MSRSFLIVLPNDMRCGGLTPLSRHSSISPRLATSKFEPLQLEHRHDLRLRVRLDRVEHPR